MHNWYRVLFASLAVRDFRNLWLGNFASTIGYWAQTVGQGWLAYTLTDSAAFLGVLGVSRALPALVVTLPAGVLADRWDRRVILLVSQFLAMVNSFVLAYLVATDSTQPWHLLATAIVSGLVHSFNMPARQSLAPELAGSEHLANAVALNAISFNSSRILGPALAGLLIGVWGLSACFTAQAVGLAWAMVWTASLPSKGPSSRTRAGASLWTNLVDGLRYIRNSPAAMRLLAVSAIPIGVGMVYLQLMPVFARDVLNVGASGMGALMSAVGAGSVLGAFAAAAISHYPRQARIQMLAGCALGVALAIFAASTWVTIALVTLVLVGGVQAILQAVNQTLLNLVTPNEYRGRVMSVYLMTWNMAPLIWLPAGWLADFIGAPITIVLSGGVVIAAILAIGLRQVEGAQVDRVEHAAPEREALTTPARANGTVRPTPYAEPSGTPRA